MYMVFLFLQTFLEQTKTKFSKNYKGMSQSKITTTVGLNSEFRFQSVLFSFSSVVFYDVHYNFLHLNRWAYQNGRVFFLNIFSLNSWNNRCWQGSSNVLGSWWPG